ncbi:unnamed protein product [Echinostoma caproni]|uniref:Adenomatous polyposis coli protein n=1 Tax=Echinostoma caproni TaxID=27848 RepID=A0A183AKL1_9TREM|nr:unnamed protein product [Echinostoma caproni]
MEIPHPSFTVHNSGRGFLPLKSGVKVIATPETETFVIMCACVCEPYRSVLLLPSEQLSYPLVHSQRANPDFSFTFWENSSDRGSPSPSTCYLAGSHSDHSTTPLAPSTHNNQPRFVHRAPPPVPGTNGNRSREPDHPYPHSAPPSSHHHLHHHHHSTSNITHSSGSTAPRPVVIDALLRLLVYHCTDPEPNQPNGVRSSMSEDQRAVLDRLYRALCTNPSGTGAALGRAYASPDWADASGVIPPLARRLLPHLIRIAYTELVSSEDGWGEDRSGLSEKNNGESDTHGRHSDRPMELAAILRLVPVYQTDTSLCERDIGIVRLLATIHAYSTTQTGRMERLRAVQALTNGTPATTITEPNSSSSSSGSASSSSLVRTPAPIEPAPRCPVAEVAALVRLSFHPEHRTAICELGGVHALIALLRCEQTLWSDPMLHALRTNQSDYTQPPGPRPNPVNAPPPPPATNVSGTRPGAEHLLETSLALRRYICMALTNLTYGVAANKALLCRRLANLEALLAQMEIGNEELKQVSASVLRNLSWRTDARSKVALRRVNAPRRLTLAAMTSHRDSTLRTTLSALWNLSAHCAHNKRAVCRKKKSVADPEEYANTKSKISSVEVVI